MQHQTPTNRICQHTMLQGICSHTLGMILQRELEARQPPNCFPPIQFHQYNNNCCSSPRQVDGGRLNVRRIPVRNLHCNCANPQRHEQRSLIGRDQQLCKVPSCQQGGLILRWIDQSVWGPCDEAQNALTAVPVLRMLCSLQKYSSESQYRSKRQHWE
jgi:hypothetical protein